MKETGFVRRIYPNGTIALPKALREFLGIEEGDPYEISLGENNEIILKPYVPEDGKKN